MSTIPPGVETRRSADAPEPSLVSQVLEISFARSGRSV